MRESPATEPTKIHVHRAYYINWHVFSHMAHAELNGRLFVDGVNDRDPPILHSILLTAVLSLAIYDVRNVVIFFPLARQVFIFLEIHIAEYCTLCS